MVLTKVGKEKIAENIKDNINVSKVGTNGTDASVLDTDLLNDAGLSITPTITRSGISVNISSVIYSSELIGVVLKEQGYYLNDILLERVVFPDFEKDSSNEFIITNVLRVL